MAYTATARGCTVRTSWGWIGVLITVGCDGGLEVANDLGTTTSVGDADTDTDADADTDVPVDPGAPLAVDDEDIQVRPGRYVKIEVALNDSDPDGLDLETVTLATDPANGVATPNADGTVDYGHDGSDTFQDAFTYTISDATGSVSNEATVTLIINDPPLTEPDLETPVNGGLLVIDVAANDTDDDGLDLSSVTIVDLPTEGTATPVGDGTVNYQHNGLGVLVDSFTYTIMDTRGGVSEVTLVTVTEGEPPCDLHPQWQAVSCTTPDWVWSSDRVAATTVPIANALQVLWTGCDHAGGVQPDMGNGLCSLDGLGWVSTQTFVMAGCDADWYHLGGGYTGNCGGHDGDTVRHLVKGINDCYAY